MFAKFKHLAIRSNDPLRLTRFYSALFGMREAEDYRSPNAPNIGDGNLGLNLLPRGAGRQAGLDHFGFMVDDVETVYARLRERYPSVEWAERPSNRPFAGISSHDPSGQIFDLCQKGMANVKGVYSDEEEERPRQVKHIALHVVEPAMVARFYTDVFELMELEKPDDDPNFYLSDGRVTMVVCPWRITDFEGGGIERPALDHIGFKVESISAVEDELKKMVEQDSGLAPVPWGQESAPTIRGLKKCKYGQYQLADPDGVLLDLEEV